MQEERIPPSLQNRVVLSFFSGWGLYYVIGSPLVEMCIGKTTLGVSTWEDTHHVIAVLSGFFLVVATECLCWFYAKQSDNTDSDLTAFDVKPRTRVKNDTELKASEYGGWIILVAFLAFLILIGAAQLVTWLPWLWPM